MLKRESISLMVLPLFSQNLSFNFGCYGTVIKTGGVKITYRNLEKSGINFFGFSILLYGSSDLYPPCSGCINTNTISKSQQNFSAEKAFSEAAFDI
jgi:hypothetical protein